MRFGIILLVLLFASCTTTQSSRFSRRGPASSDKRLTATIVAELVRRGIRIHQEDQLKGYRVARFPLRDGSEVQPLGLVQRFMDVVQDPFIRDHAFFLLSSDEDPRAYVDGVNGVLTPKERETFFDLCMTHPAHVGASITAAGLILDHACDHAGQALTDDEVVALFARIPAQPKGVRYDGRIGYHVYSDRSLERDVKWTALAINTDRERAYRLFHTLPKDIQARFQVNRTGSGEANKVEPFDLLSTMTTYLLMGESMGVESETRTDLNQIQISKLAQKAMARFLHLIDNPATEVPSLSVIRSDNNVVVLCANGIWRHERTQITGSDQVPQSWHLTSSGTQLVEIWSPGRNLDQFVQKGFSAETLRCGDNEYRFVLDRLDGEPIPVPEPIRFAPGQDVHALMTVSLINEIDRSAVEQAKALVSILTGWQVEGALQTVNTRQFLESELVRADAYFPVMHAMDVNYFNIGPERGLALRLVKQVKDESGRARLIRLAILLPDGDKSAFPVTLKPDDLAVVLDRRFQDKPTPLFLMNNSCASEKTLVGWTFVFREALQLRQQRPGFSGLASVRDFPYIIGSKRSFGTASLLEIFSHADYPLRSLELLAEGKPVEQIVSFLKEPPRKGFLQGLAGMFGGGEKRIDTEDGQGFMPEFILDHPNLMSLAGIRITVTSRTIKGENKY